MRAQAIVWLGMTWLSGCVATAEGLAADKVVSRSLAPSEEGALGSLFGAPGTEGPSSFVPLDRGADGLDARLALALAAESSIDAQSYLWHEDASGSLLLDELLEAADRGVRVRLLIDGFRLEGHESLDAALSAHPHLEIRAFNPAYHRSGVWRTVEIAENLERLDHRMHNKLFLVDGVAAVFGGRNVGDEYFGLGEEADFRDFDLMASGPVVPELAQAFDEFWNSPWAIPLDALVGDVEQHHAAARDTLRSFHSADARLDPRRAIDAEAALASLARARDAMVPGDARVLHDAAQITDEGATGILARAFEAALGETAGDVVVVTAYLVPDEGFLGLVRVHRRAGGRVRVLTNSYASTNQPLVHTYYAPAREELLDAGVELYELRADAWSHAFHRSAGSRAGKLGLHAKSAVFGPEHVVIGSMNLDPRSMQLNTELGVLIESRALADKVRAALERDFAARNAWRVERNEEGELRWKTLGLELDSDPDVGAGEHAREWFLRLLPLRGEV